MKFLEGGHSPRTRGLVFGGSLDLDLDPHPGFRNLDQQCFIIHRG